MCPRAVAAAPQRQMMLLMLALSVAVLTISVQPQVHMALDAVHAPVVATVAAFTSLPPASSIPLSNAGDGDSDAVTGGVYPLVKDLRTGDVELRAFRTGSAANFCYRAPVIVTRVPSGVAVNAHCPERWIDLSCSCVQAAQGDTVWELHIIKRNSSSSSSVTTLIPTNATSSPLAITSLGAFLVPGNLVALKLVGDSESPLALNLRLSTSSNDSGADALTLVTTERTTGVDVGNLATVEVLNIDLSSIDLPPTFIPAQVSKISLQNCNLLTLSAAFLAKRHAKLLRLDLSRNHLRTFSTGLLDTQTSAIKELNLSRNSFSGFPPSLTGLQRLERLDLSGNPITNWSVTAAQFAQLAALPVLQVDSVDTSAQPCSGTWQSVDGLLKLCVLSTTLPPPPSSSPQPTTSTTSSEYLFLAVGIPSCVLLAVIALTVQRRCCKSAAAKLDSFDVSLLECTDESYKLSIDDALLRDSVLMMHRIPYADVAVGECVNHGGFGIVYTGVYKRRRVAIKKIRAEYAQSTTQIEAFLREICMMASLEHVRIVEFVGVAWGDSLQTLSAVTEFMDRGDLHTVLQIHKAPSSRLTLTWNDHKAQIALHVAEALTYLHSLSPIVLHRDLKSKNVLLNLEFMAKLSDFGISREWCIDDSHLTVGIGTSFWIAPEVLRGERYDERADVFSFGVVLSELDTHEYPYCRSRAASASPSPPGNPNAILRMVASGETRPAFTPECPHEILELAGQCLERDPQRRPPSTRIVFALHQFLTGPQSPASSLSMDDTFY